jgi:hypothetical protein
VSDKVEGGDIHSLNKTRGGKRISIGANHSNSHTNNHLSVRHEHQVQHLKKDVEGLQATLDEAGRERDMQRFELGRLRRQVAELTNRDRVKIGAVTGPGVGRGDGNVNMDMFEINDTLLDHSETRGQ